ncbi:MAG: hypothetical protein K0Q70_2740, partial [Rhodospirillales bacterium]|nr:hypothetical protein [Rhodospirillales bacterium]
MKTGAYFGGSVFALLLAHIAILAPSSAFAAGMSCEDLAKSGLLTDTTVASATLVAAQGTMPANCKIVATIKPTPGSN